MSSKMRKLLVDHEERVMNLQGNDPKFKAASYLRKQFFTNWILNKHTNYYKSDAEKDWAYVAKREYNYKVILQSVGYGWMLTNIIWSASMLVKKKMTFLPLLSIVPSYYLFQNHFYQKHNKRLFDMCNLGVEYELGYHRNQVLQKCNDILQEDHF